MEKIFHTGQFFPGKKEKITTFELFILFLIL